MAKFCKRYRPSLGCASDAFCVLWNCGSAESGAIYVNMCD